MLVAENTDETALEVDRPVGCSWEGGQGKALGEKAQRASGDSAAPEAAGDGVLVPVRSPPWAVSMRAP